MDLELIRLNNTIQWWKDRLSESINNRAFCLKQLLDCLQERSEKFNQ